MPIRLASATLSAPQAIGGGRKFTAFVNSRKARPAATGWGSPSPSITTRRSRARPCWRNAALKDLFVAGSIRVAVSNAPELGGFLRQRRKNATQFRSVHILAQQI